jgi:hypothetical protein
MKLQQPFLKKKLTLVEKRKRFHAANILGRTFEEVDIYDAFASEQRLIVLHIFWLGKLAIEETIDNNKRTLRSVQF